MDKDKSQYPIINGQLDDKNKGIVPLRHVTVKRVGKPQTLKRRPIVRNKDGHVVWQAERDTFYYRDETTGNRRSCSFSIDGGVVIVLDHLEEVVEAYKLKDGETVMTV